MRRCWYAPERWQPVHKPWRRFSLALAARLAAMLLLFIALAYPARPLIDEKINVRVLVEQSTLEDSDEIRDRIASEISQVAKLSIGPAVTDINAALRNALWETNPVAPGVIIIASDGQWSQETLVTLSHARAAGVGVFWLPVLPDDLTPGLANMLAPEMARAGQRIGVSVDVQLAVSHQAEVVLLSNGRPVESKAIETGGEIEFVTTVPDDGPVIFGAELRDRRTGAVIAFLEQGSLTNVASTPSILLVSNGDSAFGDSLLAGGWSITKIRPGSLPGQLQSLPAYAGLVLDDIAASELPITVWPRIEKAVRQDAMGMLVLGGPHAFGLGAYRESPLESLLPVISEPPGDEAPVSLVFLVDVSGSMDRQDGMSNRLQLAREATVETARALRSVDRVGLITFDVQTRELLAIESRTDHAKSIERAWPEAASGGTLLIASLRRAIDALEEDGAEQKLLVLVTDGFLADEDLEQLNIMLGRTDVELIAMIVGNNDANGFNALSDIAAANRGLAMRVDDVLELPELMRNEVESRRPAVMTGQTRSIVMLPVPWLPDENAWPDIDAYLLTRPRESAQVHLVSERGDVILASIAAGAGRVAAVTSGFGGWTEEWLRWSRWPEFATGLTGFLAVRETNQTSISVVQDYRGGATLSVEFSDRQLATNVTAILVAPSGESSAIELQPNSPGTLSANLELNREGQYTLALRTATTTTRHRFLKQSNNGSSHHQPPIASKWVSDGVLTLWDARSLPSREPHNAGRFWWLALSLLVFLSSLVLERAHPPWKYLRLSISRRLGLQNHT